MTQNQRDIESLRAYNQAARGTSAASEAAEKFVARYDSERARMRDMYELEWIYENNYFYTTVKSKTEMLEKVSDLLKDEAEHLTVRRMDELKKEAS